MERSRETFFIGGNTGDCERGNKNKRRFRWALQRDNNNARASYVCDFLMSMTRERIKDEISKKQRTFSKPVVQILLWEWH